MYLTEKKMEELREIAENFINYIGNEDMFYYFNRLAEDFLEIEDLKDKYSIGSGESKGVFISKDSDYVIKFAFPRVEEDSMDYAEIEEYIFENARDKSWSNLFCEIVFLMKKNNITVILQKKVDVLASDVNKETLEYDSEELYLLEDFIEENDIDCGDYESFRIALLNRYSIATVIEIYKFFHEFRVNDIHDSNWGYIGDEIKIFDYSGYDFL